MDPSAEAGSRFAPSLLVPCHASWKICRRLRVTADESTWLVRPRQNAAGPATNCRVRPAYERSFRPLSQTFPRQDCPGSTHLAFPLREVPPGSTHLAFPPREMPPGSTQRTLPPRERSPGSTHRTFPKWSTRPGPSRCVPTTWEMPPGFTQRPFPKWSSPPGWLRERFPRSSARPGRDYLLSASFVGVGGDAVPLLAPLFEKRRVATSSKYKDC